MTALNTRTPIACLLGCGALGVLLSACDGTSGTPVSPTTATPVVVLQAPVNKPPVNSNPDAAANLSITFTPDPVPGSRLICGGAFWGTQTPTWSDLETIKETQGVGFTLTMLTYNFYDHEGRLTLHMSFLENHYFPPYDEHVEDGCMALGGSPSGSFEEILEGVDDNGNQLTFAGQVELLPVPK